MLPTDASVIFESKQLHTYSGYRADVYAAAAERFLAVDELGGQHYGINRLYGSFGQVAAHSQLHIGSPGHIQRRKQLGAALAAEEHHALVKCAQTVYLNRSATPVNMSRTTLKKNLISLV